MAGKPASSFNAPEGIYQLAYEAVPPPPQTPATPAGANVANAGSTALPEWPSSLSTAVMHFPAVQTSSGSGLLGLGGGSQRNARSREPSAQDTAPSQQQQQQQQAPFSPISSQQQSTLTLSDENSSANSNGSYEAASGLSSSVVSGGPAPMMVTGSMQSSSQLASSVTAANSRKKPLISLPSSYGLPSLSGTSNSSPGSSTSKPKSAFRGTSSTFIKAYEGLPLSARAERLWSGPEARDISLAIFTSGRLVLIADISLRAKSRDPIARLAFGQMPTCTAVNQNTLSHDRLDLLVGFASGDLMWIECFSGRYTRYNKDAASNCAANSSSNKPPTWISAAPVKQVAWLQGDTIFAAAFQDGCMAFFDKDRDDPASFVPATGKAPEPGPLEPPLIPLSRQNSNNDTAENSVDGHLAYSAPNGERHASKPRQAFTVPLEEYTDDIVVTIPQTGSDRKNAGRYNPLAHWKVSRKPITDFAISPDSTHVAVVSEDGCLRIIEATSQKLVSTFQAYFGALTCVNWSPDGRFVLTGGQDDLACVWSPFEQRIIARCEGHASFLTGLAFDAWRCDGRTQRFASVSEDCRIILWELSSASLQRPKAHHPHHRHVSNQHGPYNRRTSAMSSLSLSRRRTIESNANLPLNGSAENEAVSPPLWHRAPHRSEVPGLQPVTSKQISSDLLAGIAFLPSMVVTVSRNATVKVFLRPDVRTV